MPNGLHDDHRSLKHLARLVASGVLPLYRLYEIAAERLVSAERAEALVIAAKAQLEAERAASADSAARMARYLLGKPDQPELPLTAGQWISLSVGENAILVKPQPASIKVGCIDV